MNKEEGYNLKKYIFESVEEFSDKFLESYDEYSEKEDFNGVRVVAKYDFMIDFLNYLVKNTSFELFDLSLLAEICKGYADEFILAVDADGCIWIQEAKYDDEYVSCESDVIFVHSDCNSA